MADPTITGTGAVKRAEFKLFADVGEAESPEWEPRVIALKSCRWS